MLTNWIIEIGSALNEILTNHKRETLSQIYKVVALKSIENTTHLLDKIYYL